MPRRLNLTREEMKERKRGQMRASQEFRKLRIQLDPEYAAEYKTKVKQRSKRKYAEHKQLLQSDPEYAAKAKKAREDKLSLHHLRLSIDPEYAKSHGEKLQKQYDKRNRLRATDSKYREYVYAIELKSMAKNRDKILLRKRAARFRNRFLVLHHYSGGRCECCGESQWEFLAIDHVNGGGNRHRDDDVGSRSSSELYRWIIKNDYPPGFRVLCHNCNGVIARRGGCPHDPKYDGTGYYSKSYEVQRGTVLSYYGGKCECCGEVTQEFLELDHKNGDGAEHRKKTMASSMYGLAIREGFPDIFRVLCRNCNAARGFYGYCPHKSSAPKTSHP